MQIAKIFPARIDGWLWLVLIMSSLGLCLWGILIWTNDRIEALILIGAGLFDAVLFALLLYPCYYSIEESDVLIRSGLIKYRVPISEINSVTASSNPLSAPAPSLRRVEIRMKNGKFHLVSPEDRDGFMKELKLRAGITS